MSAIQSYIHEVHDVNMRVKFAKCMKYGGSLCRAREKHELRGNIGHAAVQVEDTGEETN